MNLIETLKNEFGENAVSTLSQKLDISEEQAHIGINHGIPSVLAGLLKRAAGSGTLGSLSSIFTGNTIAVTTDPELELVDEHSLQERGKSMMGDLFGSDAGAVVTSIQEESGLSSEKSTSLLTMSVPLITSYISRLIANKDWSMPDFIGQLFENKSSIEAALPMGIASTLGIGDLHLPNINPPDINVDNTVEQPIQDIPSIDPTPPPPIETEPVVPSDAVPPESVSSNGSVLKWIIIIALLILAAWWFMGQRGCNNEGMVEGGDTTAMNIPANTHAIRE